jgi:hypothetical protein
MRVLLMEQGFRVASWIDCTQAGVAWFVERERARAHSPALPKLGLHVVMGPEFSIMTSNLARNFREGLALLIEAVLEKP